MTNGRLSSLILHSCRLKVVKLNCGIDWECFVDEFDSRHDNRRIIKLH